MGILYVVSTPIGNLEDISLRALRVLREVHLIAAEDTRHTRKLLNHFDITTKTVSYHQHSPALRTAQLLEALAVDDVALVTDAGTPALSDPGGELVEAARGAGFQVVAVPGASALLTLVASAGLPAAKFTYLGFLPRKRKDRAEVLGQAVTTDWPFIVYESPQRLAATLDDIREAVGDRQVAVGRELTKLHEEIYRGTLQSAGRYFGEREVRGEVVIMVGPSVETAEHESTETEQESMDSALLAMRAQGLPAKEAAKRAARLAGVTAREAYSRLVQLENPGNNDATDA